MFLLNEHLMDTVSTLLAEGWMDHNDLIFIANDSEATIDMRYVAITALYENLDEWTDAQKDCIACNLLPVCASARLLIQEIDARFECPNCGEDVRIGKHCHRVAVDDYRCYYDHSRHHEITF